MRNVSDLFIVNGVQFPDPDEGYEIIESTFVDAGRNVNGAVVGQVVGRNIWKINNLQWSHISPEQWIMMKQALKPFYVDVTFTTDENERKTITMYPGDRTSHPLHVSGYNYDRFKTCKFNLIDCGLE